MPFLRLTALLLVLAAASVSAHTASWGVQIIVGQPPVYRVQSPPVVYPVYPAYPRQREHYYRHERERHDRNVPPGWQRPPGWNDHPGFHPNFYGPGNRWRPR